MSFGSLFFVLMRVDLSCLGKGMFLILFGEGRGRPSILKTQFPLLNMVEGAPCCEAIMRPHALGTLFVCMGLWKKQYYVTFWRIICCNSPLGLSLDNDLKHTSRFPTENLWQVLKVSVYVHKPHNLDQLEQFVMERWAWIPQETFVSLRTTERGCCQL